MYSQYPHTLMTEVAQPPTVDSNGDRVPGASAWVVAGRCREETNGKGAVITTADRKEYRFSSLVHMPSGTTPVPEGAMVRVTDDDGRVRIEAACAKFDPGRLHCRMWL